MRKQTAENSKLQSFHSLQLYPKGKEAVKSLVQLNQGRQRESPCTIFQEAAYQCLYQGDLWGVLSKYQWPEIKQSFPVRPYKRNVTRAPRWSCSRPSLLSSLSGIQFQTGFRSTGQLNQMPSSVTQWCLTLCDPKDCSMPGFPVLHHLLEFAQIHVHWVGDTLQPSHPLLSPCPLCFQSFPELGCFPMNRLFASGDQSTGASPSVLSVNTQDWFPLGLTGLISLQSKGLSRVFPNTAVQKHQFFSAQPSLVNKD